MNSKDKLRDTLGGSVSACLKIPELAQSELVKEVSGLSKVLASKEQALLKIDKVIHVKFFTPLFCARL